MAIRVSIVVPTWNRRDTLEHVLPTLLAQSCGADSYEVLLCDFASDDGTADLVASLGAPNLRRIVTTRGGRAAVRNEGIRRARGEIVLFTDADILADARLVDEHLAAHARHPDAAVVGWEVQVASIEQYRVAVARPETRRRLHRPGRRRLSWLFFLTGNASVRRTTLERAGLFDESFSDYGHEDLELGYRLSRAGTRIVYNPAAVNYHWHPESLDEKAGKRRLSGRATIRFYRKHRDWRILARLGVNPFSLAWHRALGPGGHAMRSIAMRAGRSRLCRSLVLEHAYLTGVKEALAAPPDPGVPA
jgi:glycosyltransferase involved in cell wall biosynthesis